MSRATFLLGAALALTPALLPAGCASPDDRPRGRPGLENEDTPRCFQRARMLEERSLELEGRAERTESATRRRGLYDDAVAALKEAQGLYDQELLDTPGMPPERRANCEREAQRLAKEIERLYKRRPTAQE